MSQASTASTTNWELPKCRGILRIGLALALLALPAPSVCQCRYRPESKKLPAGLKLTLSTEKPAARVSGRFVVHLELANLSGLPVRLTDRWWTERDYELHLRYGNGREAPLTESARKMRFGPILGSSSEVELAPGEKIGVDEDLADVYIIAEPGTYVLDACRDILGFGNLYSNKVVLPVAR
jgi:hypothetical protein